MKYFFIMLWHVICVILLVFSFFLQDFYMACKNTTSVILYTLALCKYITKIIYTILYLQLHKVQVLNHVHAQHW
jgi:hypothetical protein